MESSLGLVETQSFPIMVKVADEMLKSSEVRLVGYEKIGSGHCTVIVRGRFADVRLAVERGAETAKQFDQSVSKLVLPRPLPNLEVVLPISGRLAQLAQGGYSHQSTQSIGLLETRGFPAMVGAADAMLKAAEVELIAYETIGDGLCTAIIRGSVSNVAVALEVGMSEAERIGELNAVMVIPRPLDDLEQTLPLASCMIEQPQPLLVPLQISETEKELVPLQIPETTKELVPLEIPDQEATLGESSNQE
jgi:carbon dioxide concentrating mechanism protein CcmO